MNLFILAMCAASSLLFLPSPHLNGDVCCSWEGDGRGLRLSCGSCWAYVNLFNLCTERCALWTANNALRITKGHEGQGESRGHDVSILCQDQIIQAAPDYPPPLSLIVAQQAPIIKESLSGFQGYKRCMSVCLFDLSYPRCPVLRRLLTHRRVGVSHVGAVPGDVNVEVFFCGLQVDRVVEVHALLVLQLPVSPHQVATSCRHRQQY